MNQPPPLTNPLSKPPNWWGRNWKWFVPVLVVGGLTAMVAFVSLLFFGITELMSGVREMITSSPPYQMAMERTEGNPAVVDALGLPIEEGFVTSGNVSTSGTSGDADFAIPLVGPKGEGTLYVVARKSVGQWTLSQLVLAVSGSGDRIDLLAAAADDP